MQSAADNPFATRHVRPGAIPYLFVGGPDNSDAGLSIESLVERLRQNDWRGQIVGPHGSGKSTLLRSLIPAIEAVGRAVALVELHAGQRRFDWPTRLSDAERPSVLVIDGFEQLPWWRAALVKWRCRRAGCGLVVTAHRDVGLPLLHEVCPDPITAIAVVRQMLRNKPFVPVISDEDILRAFAATGGSLRETLFALYDLVEERRGPLPHAPSSH